MFDFNGKTPKEIIFNGKSLSKLLFNGIEVWRKSLLPDGYVLCEYLESTGTQYIDTGIVVNPLTDCFEIYANILNAQVGSLYGAYESIGINKVYAGITYWNNKYHYFFYSHSGDGWDTTVGINAETTSEEYIPFFKVKLDKGKIYYNDIYKFDLSPNFNGRNPSKSFYLFKTNGCGSGSIFTKTLNQQVKRFFIKKNNELAMNLIPCLDINNTPCMYDTVSKQTFYNQGTGEFKWSINPTYLSLNMFVDGFVNSSTGAVAPNSTYPRAISSPLVLFEKGKTYKLTTDLSATKTDDGVRFRIYGTDDTYKMSLGASQITTNAYATFEALDDLGKANFYVTKDILITPKQDFKARIMYIDSNYISDFKIERLD